MSLILEMTKNFKDNMAKKYNDKNVLTQKELDNLYFLDVFYDSKGREYNYEFLVLDEEDKSGKFFYAHILPNKKHIKIVGLNNISVDELNAKHNHIKDLGREFNDKLIASIFGDIQVSMLDLYTAKNEFLNRLEKGRTNE